jgi:CubicO group peptidase (beta-lactamase class C family)
MKMKMKKLNLLFIAIALISCSEVISQFAKNGLLNVNSQVTEEQAELIYENAKSFPENTQLSIAIIEDANVKFIGVIRINDTLQLLDNHERVFEIGSISKVFTATLLANYVVNHKLELNNTIQDIIDFKINSNEKITFLHLANHTSGLPRIPSNFNLTIADRNNPYRNYNKDKLIEYMTEKITLKESPGTEYDYSNLGAGLLGHILAEYTNSTYDKLLYEHIFSRYEMMSSTTDREKIDSVLVKGLDNRGNETPNWDFDVLVGAGGILSSVNDLSKFALAQFDAGNVELQLTQKSTFSIDSKMKIGMGWHIIKTSNENDVLWHNGATGGYSSSMIVDVKNKNGIIILSNVSAYNKEMGNIDNLCFSLLKTLIIK